MSTIPSAVLAALEASRGSVEASERSSSPDDAAAGIVDAWRSTEDALRALTGSSAEGQALVRELRQRDLVSLSAAHALVDFEAAARRAAVADYVPTPADRALARAGIEELERSLVRADAGVSAAPRSVPAREPVPVPPVLAPAPAAASRNLLGRVLLAAAIVTLVAASVWGWRARSGAADLRRGRSAWAAGNKLAARDAFAAAAVRHPRLAEPHLYLGRIARETGNLPLASEELRKAVALEPENFLTHRELASLMLVSGRPDLARSFYERAIRLNPGDQTSLGYMACTLNALGRPDLAQRFLARAGSGAWSACAAPAAPAAPPVVP